MLQKVLHYAAIHSLKVENINFATFQQKVPQALFALCLAADYRMKAKATAEAIMKDKEVPEYVKVSVSKSCCQQISLLEQLTITRFFFKDYSHLKNTEIGIHFYDK